jgi:hypothetical protein
MYCVCVGIFYQGIVYSGEENFEWILTNVEKIPYLPEQVIPYIKANPLKAKGLLALLCTEITDPFRVPVTVWLTPKVHKILYPNEGNTTKM